VGDGVDQHSERPLAELSDEPEQSTVRVESVAVSLGTRGILASPVVMFATSIEDILRNLQQYIDDPSQLLTGPTSTGKRDETVKSWNEHCEGTNGKTLKKDCPLQSAEWKCHYWDRVGPGVNLQGTLTVTWQYDCCNVYKVKMTNNVSLNDDAKNMGVFAKQDLEIPETDPVEIKPCSPCTPKCIIGTFTIVIYSVPIGGVPGTRRQMVVKVKLCPSSGDAASSFTDQTDYRENEGDKKGSVAAPKAGETVEIPALNDDDTWGLKAAASYPRNT
jgi:hypothetical protein